MSAATKKPKAKGDAPQRAKPLNLGAGFWSRNWKPALILFMLPLLLYAGSMRYGYVLDDKLVLSENRFVQQGSKGIRDIFAHETFTGYLGTQQTLVAGARYRPLSLATFAMEHQVFGVKPGISHGINVLLYALTALLIFRLLALVFPSSANKKWYLSLPFVTALLFALHPLHTEVVANIKGRDEILALLLALAAAYYTLRALSENGKKWQAWFAGVLFLLAILSKENAIAFLAIIPLLVFTASKFNPTIHSSAKLLIPIGLATGVYLLIRWAVIGFLLDGGQEITNLMNNPFVEATGTQRSATISLTLAWYLKLLVLPHPLTHDYYPYHVPLVEWTDWRAILGAVTHLGLVVLAVATWRKNRLISFAILYYLLTLALVANILFPVGTFMNERFLYMPSLAFCLVLAWLISQKLPQWFSQREQVAKVLALSIVGIIGAGYAVRTVTRVPDWENTLTLNTASLEVSTGSAYSNQYYGFAVYEQSEKEADPVKKKRLLDQALPYVERALEIYPLYPDALGTKTGILVGYFQLNNQIAPLLEWFEHVQKTHPLAYIDTVLQDLIAFGQHRIELNYFLQEVGYNHFWVAKGDKAMASKYLQMLKTIDPLNPNVDRAIANIENGVR